MFFITTNKEISLEKLFSRIFNSFDPVKQKRDIELVKHAHISCIFYCCKKVELRTHIVFISGNIFPNKN